jgi:hypothetical protein
VRKSQKQRLFKLVYAVTGNRYSFGLSFSIKKDKVIGVVPDRDDSMTTFQVLTLLVSFSTMIIALIFFCWSISESDFD